MVLIGLIKEKKRFLEVQGLMNIFFIVGNLFLGGISGAIANFTTLVRNVVCIKRNLNRPLKILFITIQVALTLYFDRGGIIIWLPILGACLFTWFMDTENMLLLKIVATVGQTCWGIYDFFIINYATVPFDIAAIVTNIIAIAALVRLRKAKEEKTDGTDSQEV